MMDISSMIQMENNGLKQKMVKVGGMLIHQETILMVGTMMKRVTISGETH
jgi:hypothetical protein